MKTIVAILPLLSLLLSPILTGPALAEDMPGREVRLPENEVRDRFFAYMIGLIQIDTCGVVDAEDLMSVLEDSKGKTSVPFERIHDIRRECGKGETGDKNIGRGGSRSMFDTREVSITFHGELKTPVPYSILGYHPGSVQASPTVRFREWYLRRRVFMLSRTELVELKDIYVFGIFEGWTVIDIDGWLDSLLGGSLDDTRIITLVLFKYEGDWHGLAAGFGHSNEGRSGVFNFPENKILFPTPPEFRGLGPYFRRFVADEGLDVPLPPSSKWKQDE
jgi:hypothetical protein